MNRIFLFSAVLFILFTFYPLFSQDNTDGPDLVKKTMKADIDTSSYFELQQWAESLGLDASGTVSDLRKKLYGYYGVKDVKTEDGGTAAADSIVIKSAKELESVNIDEIDETCIVLSGSVKLELVDKKKKSRHEITADKIIFNRKEKTVTAIGNIVYVIRNEDSKEYFYGEKLTFNIQSFEGVFFKGVSEKHQKTENGDRVFYFFGEKIFRKEGDKVILENGIISSSRDKNPYYHLKARKIWILNPGEWAIKQSVLYVGRVPVFAFPFMYMPGDKLVFHPVYGLKSKKGYFLNTTTYLIGQPEPDSDSSSFSFLQSSGGNKDTLLKREGLFLRKTSIPYTADDNYLKFLADYYTRKGFFIGLDGQVKNSGSVKSASLLAGIGINRYIYSDSIYGYTPYLFDSGTYETVWEDSYFFGNEFPFRFGFDLSVSAALGGFNLDLSVPVYSDTTFYRDLTDRKETFNFKNVFSSDGDQTVLPPEKDSLEWNVTAGWRMKSRSLSPYVQNLSMDRLKFDVTLFSNQLDYDTTPVDPLSYYYPQNIVYPDFSGKISGVIFSSGTGNSGGKQPLDRIMKKPWEKETPENDQKEEDVINPPDISDYEKLPYNFRYEGVKQTLSYSIQPRFTLNSILNSKIPSETDSFMTTPDYSIFSAQNTASLLYSAVFSEKLLKIDTRTTLSSSYKNHFGGSDSYEGDWETFVLQDKTSTKYSVLGTTRITSYPLLFSDDFALSNIQYSISTLYFNHYYDGTESGYVDEYLSWDTESINTHQLEMNMVYKPGPLPQTFKTKIVLPPKNMEVYPSLTLRKGHFMTELSAGYRQQDDKSWDNDPYSIFGKYTFTKAGYLSQKFLVDDEAGSTTGTSEMSLDFFDSFIKVKETFKSDISDFEPLESVTSLDLWRINYSFTAEKVTGYDFISNTGWVSNNREEFQPSKVSLGFSYDYKPDPFWKNRVNFSSDISSAWSMNMLKPTDTIFTFNLSFSLSVAEFLDLNFKSQSVNRAFYRYIPASADKIGLEDTLNPLTDLLNSFNFFNRDDRTASNFNLQLLEIEAVHHLGDWDLHVSYGGKPEIYTNSDSSKEYRWDSTLSIYVNWNPIPEIKKEITVADDEMQF